MEAQRFTVQRTVGNYLQTHVQLRDFYKYTSRQARRAIFRMQKCRTGRLGGHRMRCGTCGGEEVRINSCSLRSCSVCSGPKRTQWKQKVLQWALECDYLHEVFTLPHELNDLMFASDKNKVALFRQIMQCAIDTLETIAERAFGCKVGLVVVLHTWGQQLKRHVHVHVIMSAGGLSLDGQSWVPIHVDDPAMRPDALAAAFKKTYLRRTREKLKTGLLDPPRDTESETAEPYELRSADEVVLDELVEAGIKKFGEKITAGTESPAEPETPIAEPSVTNLLADAKVVQLLRRIEAKDWVVDVKPTPPEYRGAEGIVNYLAGYISGAAIGDSRILSDDGTTVTIRFKDYKNQRAGELSLRGEKLVRRLTDHILPKGVRRVRYAGLFGPAGRCGRLDHCRLLLLAYAMQHNLKIPKRLVDGQEAGDDGAAAPEIGSSNCRQCKTKMKLAQRIKPDVIQHVMQAGARLLLYLLAEAEPPDHSYGELIERLLVRHHRELGIGYFRTDDIGLLKTYTQGLLDAELARREAQEQVAHPANPPPENDVGAHDVA